LALAIDVGSSHLPKTAEVNQDFFAIFLEIFGAGNCRRVFRQKLEPKNPKIILTQRSPAA
jgi:hypothetical protein